MQKKAIYLFDFLFNFQKVFHTDGFWGKLLSVVFEFIVTFLINLCEDFFFYFHKIKLEPLLAELQKKRNVEYLQYKCILEDSVQLYTYSFFSKWLHGP